MSLMLRDLKVADVSQIPNPNCSLPSKAPEQLKNSETVFQLLGSKGGLPINNNEQI